LSFEEILGNKGGFADMIKQKMDMAQGIDVRKEIENFKKGLGIDVDLDDEALAQNDEVAKKMNLLLNELNR
jgi:predicted unusual protein kinase regulating ubiquinone biosynthesis (AarF/ABC1/UbiB family)